MQKLTTFFATLFVGAIFLVLALAALAGSAAAALNSASLLGMVCLAGLMGVFGLGCGLAVGALAGYMIAHKPIAPPATPAGIEPVTVLTPQGAPASTLQPLYPGVGYRPARAPRMTARRPRTETMLADVARQMMRSSDQNGRPR